MSLNEQEPLCPIIPVHNWKKKEWCKPRKKDLIVNLLEKKIGFKFLKNKMEEIWGLNSTLNLTYVGNNYYIVWLNDEIDYNHALQDGPWMISNHYLVVQRWHLEFDHFEENYWKLVVWIWVQDYTKSIVLFLEAKKWIGTNS